MHLSRLSALFLLLVAARATAAVVINEVMYHPPDDLDGVQFIELHNSGPAAAPLAGWRITGGVKYTFPAAATIPAGGYLVLCKDQKAFKRAYALDASAQFDGALAHGKDTVELRDKGGKTVDAVTYRSRAPWPLAPDGHGSSLERVCPDAPGGDASNWAPSPLPPGTPRPAGTPGRKNATHSATPPPAITDSTFKHSGDGPVEVEAAVKSVGKLADVELLWRVAGPGRESAEKAIPMKAGPKGRFTATIPAQKAGQIIRFRIRAVDAKKAEAAHPHPNEVRPALSVYSHEKFTPGKIPLGLVINVGEREHRAAATGGPMPRFGAAPAATPPARGASAYAHVDHRTGKPELFDFIGISPRPGGRKLRFHKDHPLDGMRTVNLIHEGNDRFALTETLSYDIHRAAGNAAPRTDFVRTWIDGRPIGYQLLIEQPNKSYLKRNGLRTDGSLYKANWTGWTVAGRHERKSPTNGGHDDVIALVSALNRTKGDEQWALIKKDLDAPQVLTHYAARMILSDWDGFFNNYFLYHDARGTKKWTLHPWDQDKTWGFHDGVRAGEVWVTMPLTFGMLGDKPPPLRPGEPNFGFGGPPWWRVGGDISRPVLADPSARKAFLARVKDLLENVYTDKAVLPKIAALGERLEEEFAYRATLHREDPKAATRRLSALLDEMREHLKKRREFLLKQDEIKAAGKYDRAALR